MVIKTITLQALNRGVAPVVHAVYGDANRSLRLVIADITLLSSMSGQLAMYREDNTFYSITCEMDVANNRFVADITQALTCQGTTRCQLKIFQSSKIVSSYEFQIKVLPSVVPVITREEYLTVVNASDAALAQVNVSTKLNTDAVMSNSDIDSILV